MAEISVIVPVYNVELYIEKCIKSIVNQTFSDIEILLVDDGTKDKSGEICEYYSEKDVRIKVIHKENGGLSDARNVGMQFATGKYIIFIDSDDYIKEDMLEYMYNNIKKSGADFSTCGVYDVYGDHVVKQKYFKEELVSGEQAFSYILQGTNIKGAIWNKLFKREVIENLEFPVGKTYEDVFFTCDLMERVNHVYVGTQPKYYYIHRENSITTRRYSKSDNNIIEGYTKTYNLIIKKYPRLQKEAEFRLYWSYLYVFDKIIACSNYKKIAQYKELKILLRKSKNIILSNPYFQKNRKIGVIILSLNVWGYRNIMLWNQRKNLKLYKEI